MKQLKSLLFILFLALMFIGCDKEESNDPVTPAPTPTPTPTTGTIAGTRVAVYANFDDWNADRTLQSVGADANGNYSISNLPPGTYYLDAWKDQNGDGNISLGDLYNVYGSGTWPNYQLSPISIAAGQTASVSLQLVQL
jgi:hypothetical protein